jgi:hypothetical protein
MKSNGSSRDEVYSKKAFRNSRPPLVTVGPPTRPLERTLRIALAVTV